MKQRISFINFLPFILWLILVYILLTLPGKDFDNVGVNIPNVDKIVHMGLFGGVVFWFGLAYRKYPFKKVRNKLLTATIFSCLFGVAMEYVQKYFTAHTRSFSYEDMLADAAGAIAGFLFVRFIILRSDDYKTAR